MRHTYDTINPANLCDYYPHNNTLAIHSDAITPNNLPIHLTLDWMHKPYAERIEASPYRDAINAEIAKHPNCTLTEFCDPIF